MPVGACLGRLWLITNLADYLCVGVQQPPQQWIAAVVQAPEVAWAASPFASEAQRAAFEDDGDARVRGAEPTAHFGALARARSWCAGLSGLELRV